MVQGSEPPHRRLVENLCPHSVLGYDDVPGVTEDDKTPIFASKRTPNGKGINKIERRPGGERVESITFRTCGRSDANEIGYKRIV